MAGVAPSQARLDGEAGFSIVEAIVATMLLAVGVLAVVASMGAAARTEAAGGHRQEAARLASSELETIRAFPYAEVGIALTSRGYLPRFESRPTVTGAVNRVDATGTRTVGGTTYAIGRHVTWAPIQVGAVRNNQGYKWATVLVSWTDATGSHQIRQDTGLYQVAG
ncbi:MAG: hypothetical protein OEY70_17445 [Acidimicrobiia bacterium]|nr:hypothetical protein [Acidimicrobiia bacterium]